MKGNSTLKLAVSACITCLLITAYFTSCKEKEVVKNFRYSVIASPNVIIDFLNLWKDKIDNKPCIDSVIKRANEDLEYYSNYESACGAQNPNLFSPSVIHYYHPEYQWDEVALPDWISNKEYKIVDTAYFEANASIKNAKDTLYKISLKPVFFKASYKNHFVWLFAKYDIDEFINDEKEFDNVNCKFGYEIKTDSLTINSFVAAGLNYLKKNERCIFQIGIKHINIIDSGNIVSEDYSPLNIKSDKERMAKLGFTINYTPLKPIQK